ncbi:biopolymer transporter TonB [Hansschlegelia plantiphila]|uniref:Biopolymer transporter TonB n=1 Tax=Hansschlegelia plantiphila TaxID=374655 RepID=A0A9W6MW41_9HYPH|nr:biopolymer transporter TonB [Hansschlegelia plantiphila]
MRGPPAWMSMSVRGFDGRSRRGEVALWAGACVVALAAHIGLVTWALRRPPATIVDSPPLAIMMELSSTPEAVETEETNEAQDATVSENVESKTVEPVRDPVEEETPEETNSEPAMDAAEEPSEESIDEAVPVEERLIPQPKAEAPAVLVHPKPSDRKKAEKTVGKSARRKSAPQSRQADQAQAQVEVSTRTAASASSSSSGASVSPAQWQSRLMSHLERRKKYPSGARSRGEAGIAYVRFRIDDSGNVVSASLARSSGFPELDAEVVDLARRASPVPPPPPGVNKTVTAPVRFSVR